MRVVRSRPHHPDFFCAEPAGQCTDWLDLVPRYGPRLPGGARIEPGRALTPDG